MKENEYWNAYYKQNAAPTVPSQFAAFASSELARDTTIIEIGCGNGRDSLFFARYGFHTIGIDRSQEAIAFCNAVAAHNDLSAKFICSDIQDLENSFSFFEDIQDTPVVIYSRFFLHAITDSEESCFLAFVKTILDRYDGKLFLEFRTNKDMELRKTTAQHFRRFIKPFDFISRATLAGLKTSYFAEGFGFAKHKDEDAHVARIILERRCA